MQFNSLVFALFLIPWLVVCYLTPRAWRWLPLLAASYVFYAFCDGLHLWVLLALTAIAYGTGLWLERIEDVTRRRRLLWVGLGPLFAVLVGSRYLASAFPGIPAFAVPLGISFVTLRLASYLIDVSRKTIAPERRVGIFATHAAIFPELPSGPIERAGSLLPQLRLPTMLTYEMAAGGAKLFAWGLFKKLVIADRLRLFVDAAYDASSGVCGAAYLAATVFFAVQIYCDFSGYSDMAIGLGEMFGLRFAKNFDRPYRSRSIPEFWTRWHMSLSFWLRDYVFVPIVYSMDRALDGRLKSERAAESVAYGVAASVTMALCGLWHGLTWNYLAWGLVMAMFMVSSVVTRKARNRLARRFIGRRWRGVHDGAKVAVTFALVNVSWVFFRAGSVGLALRVLASIPRGLLSYGSTIAYAVLGSRPWSDLVIPFRLGQTGFDLLVVVAGITLLTTVEVMQGRGSIRARVGAFPAWLRLPLYVMLVLAIVVFRAQAPSRFIYAGF